MHTTSRLAGATPRYNVGRWVYQPRFESEVDLAVYIVAQKTPSKRDTEYPSFAMARTGLDESQARALGASVAQRREGPCEHGEAWEPVDSRPPVTIPPVWTDRARGRRDRTRR